MKRKRAESCAQSLAWLEDEGFTATKVVLRDNKSGAAESVVLDAADLLGPDETQMPDEQLDILNMALYIKDKHNNSVTILYNYTL